MSSENENLRQAAARMRERAEAVKAGTVEPGQWFGAEELADALTWAGQAEMGNPEADAGHAASWHPDAALAVADLLEVIARDAGTSSLAHHAARAVAREYLGESE